jgi:hypothetical protein
MKSRVHRHSAPEAWYTISGETCLETPDGTMLGRAGDKSVIVPQGPPMELTETGTEIRRALVLILHDSAQPHTTLATDWTPQGLCKAGQSEFRQLTRTAEGGSARPRFHAHYAGSRSDDMEKRT